MASLGGLAQCLKWLNSKIKRNSTEKEKNPLYDKFKRTGWIIDHANYEIYRNTFTNEIRESKKAERDKLVRKTQIKLLPSQILVEDVKGLY